jgi:hypothetical protein
MELGNLLAYLPMVSIVSRSLIKQSLNHKVQRPMPPECHSFFRPSSSVRSSAGRAIDNRQAPARNCLIAFTFSRCPEIRAIKLVLMAHNLRGVTNMESHYSLSLLMIRVLSTAICFANESEQRPFLYMNQLEEWPFTPSIISPQHHHILPLPSKPLSVWSPHHRVSHWQSHSSHHRRVIWCSTLRTRGTVLQSSRTQNDPDILEITAPLSGFKLHGIGLSSPAL